MIGRQQHSHTAKGEAHARTAWNELDWRKAFSNANGNSKGRKKMREKIQSHWFARYIKGGAFWHYAIQQIFSKIRSLYHTQTHIRHAQMRAWKMRSDCEQKAVGGERERSEGKKLQASEKAQHECIALNTSTLTNDNACCCSLSNICII